MADVEHPVSLRLTDEDKTMLDYLKERLGMRTAQVIRHALRKLYQAEKKQEQ